MARIAVAATAPFGADVLGRLAARHEIVRLLTRPDMPRGRGRMLGPPPAKATAERLGIPVLQPERLGPDVELDADTVVIAAYGLLVPPVLLERALWLNVHPSLLPRWRGAAPIERAIIEGDPETGVTIHKTVEALDAGPIAAQEAFPIGPEDDYAVVFRRCVDVAIRLLDRVLEREPTFTPQPEDGVTYAEKITGEDRDLDSYPDPAEKVRRVRALSYVGSLTFDPQVTRSESRGLIVWKARLDAEGRFEPLVVQPPSRKRMTYAEFLRGLRA